MIINVFIMLFLKHSPTSPTGFVTLIPPQTVFSVSSLSIISLIVFSYLTIWNTHNSIKLLSDRSIGWAHQTPHHSYLMVRIRYTHTSFRVFRMGFGGTRIVVIYSFRSHLNNHDINSFLHNSLHHFIFR